jgi:hypothetical protein
MIFLWFLPGILTPFAQLLAVLNGTLRTCTMVHLHHQLCPLRDQWTALSIPLHQHPSAINQCKHQLIFSSVWLGLCSTVFIPLTLFFYKFFILSFILSVKYIKRQEKAREERWQGHAHLLVPSEAQVLVCQSRI